VLPLGKAEVLREGDDVTVVGYGSQLQILRAACDMAREKLGVNAELIDLRTILPWDADTVCTVRAYMHVDVGRQLGHALPPASLPAWLAFLLPSHARSSGDCNAYLHVPCLQPIGPFPF